MTLLKTTALYYDAAHIPVVTPVVIKYVATFIDTMVSNKMAVVLRNLALLDCVKSMYSYSGRKR